MSQIRYDDDDNDKIKQCYVMTNFLTSNIPCEFVCIVSSISEAIFHDVYVLLLTNVILDTIDFLLTRK